MVGNIWNNIISNACKVLQLLRRKVGNLSETFYFFNEPIKSINKTCYIEPEPVWVQKWAKRGKVKAIILTE